MISKRFIKFCIIGAIGVFVNLFFLYLFKLAGLFYLASIIAIEISIMSNFLLNDIWTFHDRKTAGKKSFIIRLIKWNILRGATSLIINFGIFYVLTYFSVNYIISQLIGIVFATLIAYSLSLSWIWR